jgi:proteic killer suppression protein
MLLPRRRRDGSGRATAHRRQELKRGKPATTDESRDGLPLLPNARGRQRARRTPLSVARIPKYLWPIVRRKLDQLNRAATIKDMKAPPNNRLMKLGGGYKIRVNDQYRITFKFGKGNATDVLVSDTH